MFYFEQVNNCRWCVLWLQVVYRCRDVWVSARSRFRLVRVRLRLSSTCAHCGYQEQVQKSTCTLTQLVLQYKKVHAQIFRTLEQPPRFQHYMRDVSNFRNCVNLIRGCVDHLVRSLQEKSYFWGSVDGTECLFLHPQVKTSFFSFFKQCLDDLDPASRRPQHLVVKSRRSSRLVIGEVNTMHKHTCTCLRTCTRISLSIL